MKKLTTGIFTVVLGLVVADASAAVTSKAYVDARVGAVDTKVDGLETTVNDFKTNIGDTITNQIIDELTSADSEISKALATKADKTQVATDIATAVKTETDRAKAAEEANSNAIGALTTRVSTNETDIDNLQTAVSGLTTGENSVKSQIDTALGEYNNTMNTVLIGVNTAVADAKKAGTDAQSSVDSLAGVVNNATTGLAATKKIADDAAAAVAKETTDRTAADEAIDAKIGTVAEGKTVVQMITEAAAGAEYDDAAVKADIKKNADAISAMDTAYKAADTALTTAVEKAQSDATKGITAAAAAQATANAAIPAPTDECANPANKCVLTYNNATYAWEVIERESGQ